MGRLSNPSMEWFKKLYLEFSWGVSETPDSLGTVTTTTRFRTPKEGISHLDATAATVKKG